MRARLRALYHKYSTLRGTPYGNIGTTAWIVMRNEKRLFPLGPCLDPITLVDMTGRGPVGGFSIGAFRFSHMNVGEPNSPAGRTTGMKGGEDNGARIQGLPDLNPFCSILWWAPS